MGAVTTSLAEQARSIFAELGYAVTESGSELRAEHELRTVRVTPYHPESLPESGDYRCFVTDDRRADELRRRLVSADPPYEWAVLTVDDDGNHSVVATAD